MTIPPRLSDDAAVDGPTRDALWRLRARLVTPPVSERAESDLDAIYAAAADYAHDDPKVRQLHQRRFVALERVGRVAAVVVLIGGTAAGVSTFGRDAVQVPIVEGASDAPLASGTTTAGDDVEAADEVGDAGESAASAAPGNGQPEPVPTVTVTETETEIQVIETEAGGQAEAPSRPSAPPTTSTPTPSDPPPSSEPEPPSEQPTEDPDDLDGFGGRGDRPCPTPSPSDTETEPGDEPTDEESPEAGASEQDTSPLPGCQPSPSPTPTESGEESEGENAGDSNPDGDEATPESAESPEGGANPTQPAPSEGESSVLP